MTIISYADFEKVDLRVGRIVHVEDFPEARKPAFKLTIDFGPEIGMKRSSAQITELYTKESLLQKTVVGVVNFAEKQIGPFSSQVLTCGAKDAGGRVALLTFLESDLPLGSRIY